MNEQAIAFPSPIVISTPRLNLVLLTPDEVLAQIAALPPVERAEVSPDWLARVKATPPGDPWSLSFAAVERASGATVGGCAFKGPPDENSTVELAYGVDPAHRGRGYATEAAGALAAFAFAGGKVDRVRAHTKPDNVASARVLARCGFRYVGEVIEPEDGLVHRWEMVQGQTESGAGPDRIGKEDITDLSVDDR
jgi:RimJ/RimL family protein N-acetyltransferase